MPTAPDSLGFLVADVSRLMRRAFQQRLLGSALTLAQARALIYIERHEGVRQVDLAELLEVQPITLARLIDQLAAAGVVQRRPVASDRRAYQIVLTDAAQPHLTEIRRVIAALRADSIIGISDGQAAAIASGLDRMRDNLAVLVRQEKAPAVRRAPR
jgi:DNA-binding MarR family transcriptional regulator